MPARSPVRQRARDGRGGPRLRGGARAAGGPRRRGRTPPCVGTTLVTLPATRATVRWTAANVLVLTAVVALAAAIRAVLLPTEGFRFDLDVFARWAHEVAVGPVDRVYGGDINLPPVMVY